MRNIRLSTGPTALFGAMLVVALIVFLPMRLVMGWAGVGDQGVVARAVSGTIWGSTLSEVKFGDLALGDLRARLSPLPLLAGRATVVLDGPGGVGAPPLSGKAFVSRSSTGVESLTARLATGTAFQPLPVSTIDLDAVTVRFQDGQCVAAEGRVVATLVNEGTDIVLPTSVSGNARCDVGALLLPLASAAGTEAIALRLSGNGTYRADLSLRTTDPVAVERLTATGFMAGPDGYKLSVEGRF